MKLKFVDQPYQTEAVNSICDIFDGCELKDSLFTIDISQDLPMNEYIETEGVSYLLGHSNKLSIGNDVLMGSECLIITRNHKFDDVTIPIRLQGFTKE